MTTQTPAKRTIRRDRGAAANHAPATAAAETQQRIPSKRETLIDYDQGLVAVLNVGGKGFYNATPQGTDDQGNPNQPYHQFQTGIPGHLVRLRDVGQDDVPTGGKIVCNFKVVRVTDFNADQTVKRVSVVVTGKPTDAEPNIEIKASGNVVKVRRTDGDQLIAIDNMAGLVIAPIAIAAKLADAA